MVKKSIKDNPTARILRAAGYRPLPRLWVTEDEFQLVRYMARQHFDAINALRTEAQDSVEVVVVQHDATDTALLVSADGMRWSAKWIARTRVEILETNGNRLLLRMSRGLAKYNDLTE